MLGGRTGRVLPGASDLHRPFRPVVAVLQRNPDRVGGVVRAVIEPIVEHELQPARGEQVEARRRHELAPGEQLATYQARVGIEQRRLGLAPGFGERHVAPEPRAGPAHGGRPQVVEAAVGGPAAALLGAGGRRLARRPRLGVEQVEAAQIDAQRREVGDREPERQTMPVDVAIEAAEGRGDQR
jgi:hypothetical protein